MSGIYIHDMKMPENCFQCPAHEWFDFGGENHGYQCPILRTTTCISNCEARTKRRDNCPMIPVPPHGRLIDGDALKENWCVTELGNKVVEVVEIDGAPTIIPADKEDLL